MVLKLTVAQVANYIVGNPPVKVSPSSSVNDIFTSGSVTIEGYETGDVLVVTTTGTAISDTEANGVLTLTGPDKRANFVSVFDSLTFNATQFGTGSRTLQFSMTDGVVTLTGATTVSVGASSQTIFNYAMPANPNVDQSNPGQVDTLTVGTQFVPEFNGNISGILFPKGANDTGVHVGALWDSSGNLLISGTFNGETASGWQTLFVHPTAVVAGNMYVVGVYHPNGYTAADLNVFDSQFTNTAGGLTVPASGGVFAYNIMNPGTSGLLFPTEVYAGSNYYSDVIYTPTSQSSGSSGGSGTGGGGTSGSSGTSGTSGSGGVSTLGTNSLQPMSVAMPNVYNGAASGTASDPYAAHGGCAWVWNYLNKTALAPMQSGQICYMPPGVGVNQPENWGGDVYVWGAGNDPVMDDPNGPRDWMISVGLNYGGAGAISLTQAAAAGQPLYGSNAPMDGNWSGAAGTARFGNSIYSNNAAWVAWEQGGPLTLAQMRDVIIIRPGWEFTGGWYAWGVTAPDQSDNWETDFCNAFVRCVEITKQICSAPDVNGNTTKVLVALNPNGDYSFPDTAFGNTTLQSMIDAIGVQNIDMLCVDVYDEAQYEPGLDSSGNPLQSPQDRFDNYILPNLNAIAAIAAANGLAVGICEYGVGAFGENVPFIAGVSNWAKTCGVPVAILGYWNIDSGYNSQLLPGIGSPNGPLPTTLVTFVSGYGS